MRKFFAMLQPQSLTCYYRDTKETEVSVILGLLVKVLEYFQKTSVFRGLTLKILFENYGRFIVLEKMLALCR